VEFLPEGELPAALPRPLFSILDAALSNEIRRQIGKPFWLDTVGRSNFIEIRVKLDDSILRVVALRGAAYASNSHIFLLWMIGTSFVLTVASIAFLRNQIKPILLLAGAAEAFGKGRELDFHPRGAREVRQAGYAFVEMKGRIERAFEQRTAMLNGVSHDLRTILTRFKLSLALMGESEETQDLQKDVEEMQRMLEAYLAFARGDAGESAANTDIEEFLEDLRLDAERAGFDAKVSFSGDPLVTVRPDAFKRCLSNLIGNAQSHANRISIEAVRDRRFLTIHVDDDGPGIPPGRREDVFRPFFRLDAARNQDEGGTGLGLAIARDIARSHGGDISLGDSKAGGLRATVRVPV
jgi:two-component system, OmpR family, osmolarity sensor histidine kinase EnvZ